MACKSVFTAKAYFTSHMSRKHSHWSESVICAPKKDTHCEHQTTSAPIQEPVGVLDAKDTVGKGSNFSKLYLRNIYMFYIKLHGQGLLPVSTIQNIFEEMQNIHELGQTYTLYRLNLLLKDMSVSCVAKISESIKHSFLFTAVHWLLTRGHTDGASFTGLLGGEGRVYVLFC